MQPPVGKGETIQAAREATVWTLFHYGITGWGMYALMGMALGYFAYRRKKPLSVRSALHPIFGDKLDGPLGHTIDGAAILGTIFGVATTLGIGVVQLNVGLQILFGIDQGIPAQVGLVILAVAMATARITSPTCAGIPWSIPKRICKPTLSCTTPIPRVVATPKMVPRMAAPSMVCPSGPSSLSPKIGWRAERTESGFLRR